MVKYITKEFKTALNKLKFPDSWFWTRYTTNPYSGCEHACIYCDARSDRYYLKHDFENQVIIKTGIDKILESRLKRARSLPPDVVGAGGVNDAYQQVEVKAENTRKILNVLAKYKFPINIATKSKLITRDLDIYKKIQEDTWATIGFSITTTNEELAGFLEPFSSTPKERLNAMKEIKEKAPQIQVGTYLMPIIPFIEDSEENIEDIIKKSKQAGADFIVFSPGVTLRDSQAEFFYNCLKSSKYKHVVQPLKELYGNKMPPAWDYNMKINKILLMTCKKHDIDVRVKRWIPKDYRKWNYKISELLLNKEYMNSLRGQPNKNMMWAGLNLNNLEESILDVYKRGELLKVRNFNKKIVELVEPYLEKSKDLARKTGLDRFT